MSTETTKAWGDRRRAVSANQEIERINTAYQTARADVVRLEAENARLKAERAEDHKRVTSALGRANDFRDDNARLRAALKVEADDTREMAASAASLEARALLEAVADNLSAVYHTSPAMTLKPAEGEGA